ncbi:MAG: hypothetical protein SGJ13_07520 [Actinomycetota bacterium]|nr:hypothetical protein [Actinomycetota bacterium]
MLTLADVTTTAKVSLTKNLISDQTATNLHYLVGTPVFDATYGHGISTETSVAVAVGAGGFSNQRMTAVMRYRTATTAGLENLGVMARIQTTSVAGTTAYYYARVSTGSARITNVAGAVFTNLTSAAFALQQDVDVTITFTLVGSALSASFAASGMGTVNLSATDTTITTGGLMGYRTLSKVGWCSSFTAEQL